MTAQRRVYMFLYSLYFYKVYIALPNKYFTIKTVSLADVAVKTMHLIIWIIGTILGTTWRVTILDPHGLRPYNDQGRGRIYCFWHAHLLALSYIFRATGKTAVVSRSKDGLLAAAVAKRWRHAIIFGSSSRGGSAALRDCVRFLKTGSCVAITPDGPRGPREKVKAGIAQIALLSGAPVVAVGLRADRAWRLRSWDCFLIPKPFARIKVSIGEPIRPQIGTLTDQAVEELRATIEMKLTDNAALAD